MRKFLRSCGFAGAGLLYCLRSGRNFKIQLLVATAVIVTGCWLTISRVEWTLLLLNTGIVLSLEMLNTSMERLCDIVTKEQHPSIRLIKDVAAGAVLLFSVIAAITGLIIFLPKLGLF